MADLSIESVNPRTFLEQKVKEILDIFNKDTGAEDIQNFADELSIATSSPSTDAPVEEPGAFERIRRRDLDSDRSIFSQRVERQMEKTGMDQEKARQAVLDRRASREERLEKLIEDFGYKTPKAKRILRYTNLNRPDSEDSSASEPNYNRSRRILDLARRKGLTRAEAASILASREERLRKEKMD